MLVQSLSSCLRLIASPDQHNNNPMSFSRLTYLSWVDVFLSPDDRRDIPPSPALAPAAAVPVDVGRRSRRRASLSSSWPPFPNPPERVLKKGRRPIFSEPQDKSGGAAAGSKPRKQAIARRSPSRRRRVSCPALLYRPLPSPLSLS